MMKTLQFILLCFLSVSVYGQDLTLEPGTFSWEFGEAEMTEQIGYTLTNTTASDLNWTWAIEKSEDFPAEWTVEICDQISCWAPNAASMPNTSSGTNVLAPGASTTPSLNYIKVKNKGVAGTGSVKFCIHGDFNFAEELICSQLSTSIDDLDLKNINIFPNPTQDYFQVSADDKISQLEIINIVGKKVRTFTHGQNATYDVSDLRKGLYVVRLINNDGQQVKSMRLSKR